jgi:23S rRNA (uridine2552-2'-O)-methyltransferase
MLPQTSLGEADTRQIDLATQAIEIAQCVLRPNGNFFVKVFEGDLLNDFVLTIKTMFEEVKLVKPQASRQKSSEMYLLALGLKTEREYEKVC